MLLLDAAIRDWVLLPIVAVMFLVSALRHYLALATASVRAPDERALSQNQVLQRARQLHKNHGYISEGGFKVRRAFFNAEEGGALRSFTAANPMAMMTDPSHMTDMMKNSIGNILPNAVMMGWVNLLCSGFVIAKFPFPLSARFRGMVQRGVDLDSLDVSYVTSLSMYFLILFGLRGLFALTLGDSQIDDAAMMQKQMTMGMGMGGDVAKAAQTERDNLDITTHVSALADAERDLLRCRPVA